MNAMNRRFELKDLENFLSIAKAGSLSRASLEENVPKATLSHSLRRLEDMLNVTLVQRRKDGVRLTEAGQTLLEHSGLVFEACETAASASRSAHSAIDGTIRIAATYEFGSSVLGAAAVQLARENPGMDFDLQFFPNDVLFQRSVDFDCMIYFGQPPSSNLVARKIGEVHYKLYAAKSLIERIGPIRTIDDLEAAPGVLVSRGGFSEDWKMTDGHRAESFRFLPRFRVQDYWMAKFIAVSGEAVAFLPSFFAHYETETEALVHVLPRYTSAPRNVYVLYPSARHRNPRTQMVADKLRESFNTFILHPGYQIDAPLP